MVFKPGQAKTGGRRKGTANKLTDEVRRLAGEHTKAAIARLAAIMENKEGDERAQVAAANSLLDRAYGKAGSTMGIDPENNQIKVVIIGDDSKL